MKHRNDSTLKIVLVASAILLIPLAGYVTAYFARTVTWGTVRSTGAKCRVYPSATETLIFMPAARVESLATGRDITTAWKPY
jgi:hypothetical protein